MDGSAALAIVLLALLTGGAFLFARRRGNRPGAPFPSRRIQLPFPPNPLFTGRDALLDQVRQELLQSRAVVLAGPPGCGVSEAVLAYAFRYEDQYTAIFRLPAETPEALDSALASTARLWGLAHPGAREQAPAIEAFHLWLRANPGWLCLLDNTTDPQTALTHLPLDAHGHVLLTAPKPTALTNPPCLLVPPLDPADAAAFLAARSGRASDPGLHRLAGDLACLPLALDLAGAWMRITGSGPEKWREAMEERRLPAMQPSLATAAQMAVDPASRDPEAARTLNVCAFLHHEGIPAQLLRPESSPESPADPPMAALETLVACGLLKRHQGPEPGEDRYAMHPLLQAAVRRNMRADALRRGAEQACYAVSRDFPFLDAASQDACERLLPHALACAAHITGFGFAESWAARLLNQAGMHLLGAGDSARAAALLQNALDIWEGNLGESHVQTVLCLNSLAMAKAAQNDSGRAEELLRRALNTTPNREPDRLRCAAVRLNLSLLCMDQNRYGEASELLQDALADAAALGPDHARLAVIHDALALLACLRGRSAAAIAPAGRALEIREQALGTGHPDTACSCCNLAAVHIKQGKHALPLGLLRRGHDILAHSLGQGHPKTCAARTALARLQAGAASPALGWLHAPWPDHPNTASYPRHWTALPDD